MGDWHVYMVKCRDGCLYTGIAKDVERRFAEHQANKGAKYLRGRGPLKLVFKRRVGERGQALQIERMIKKLPKRKKEDLIQSDTGLEKILVNRFR